MKYNRTIRGTFIDRPNRFIAHVMINNEIQVVHVKNTGRLKELLLPGTDVIMEISDNPKRKTAYDLVSVFKAPLGWVNIDSQAANKIAREWLNMQNFDLIRPEYTYGESRVDFYMEKNGEKYLMEVKGCTLEINGIGYFPDAPTERGVKHLKELIRASEEGYHTAIAFVIQMNGIKKVLPNMTTHPAFGHTLKTAVEKGVRIYYICCQITENEVIPL